MPYEIVVYWILWNKNYAKKLIFNSFCVSNILCALYSLESVCNSRATNICRRFHSRELALSILCIKSMCVLLHFFLLLLLFNACFFLRWRKSIHKIAIECSEKFENGGKLNSLSKHRHFEHMRNELKIDTTNVVSLIESISYTDRRERQKWNKNNDRVEHLSTCGEKNEMLHEYVWRL